METAPRDRVPVYFLRHTFEQRDELVHELRRQRLGAVDYLGGASRSVAPADYDDPAAKSVIRRMGEVVAAGRECLVACDYRAASNRELVVGQLDLDYGFTPLNLLTVEVKTIRLKNARELVYRYWPLFAACHPQRGTFCRWHAMERSVRHWYYEGRVPREVTALGPAQLELLCQEWLRGHRGLSHLLAPVGRGLKDVDIAGARRDRTRIFAQVTFESDVKVLRDKAGRLKSLCAAGDGAILFAAYEADTLEGCEVIPIERVFAESGTEILDDLLGALPRS